MAKARSLNKVQLIGNLTRDPVLKQTANSFTVCTFGVATNSSWKDASGSIKERAEFHNIVAWNKLAEVCTQILGTGMLVYLEGELRTRAWTDEKGEKRYRTEIKLDDMILLDGKDKEPVGLDKAKELGNDSSEEFEEEAAPVEAAIEEVNTEVDEQDLF
jgi:single-strand DNA-binding protein